MKQLTMFKVICNKNDELDPLAQYIEEYLVEYHFGEDDPLPMKELAGLFSINERLVRKMVNEIRVNGTYYIVGSIKGYYAVKKHEYIDYKMKAKTVNSMNRLVKSNPKMLNSLYLALNELKKEMIDNA